MIAQYIDYIYEFFDAGGDVLIYIGLLIFVMWAMILERVFYLTFAYRKYRKNIISQWKARADRKSWNAEQIRLAMISRVKQALNQSLPTINTLVALCPLLGLLGTVTGMIAVFDVMAASGSGSARQMAAGVSKATIPTMAGMVGAISGVLAATWLKQTVKRESELLEDKLVLDHQTN